LTQGAAALKYRVEGDTVFRTKPTKVRFSAAALAAASLVAGCHGGGDVNGPAPTFTVGGTVSGVAAAGLVLQLNGTESLPVNADGPFIFTTLVAAGSTFGVMVTSQPFGESCVVDNGGGAMPTAAVTNVAVSCSTLGSFNIAGLSDPLAPQQWHLKNTGQTGFADTPGVATFDINVDPAFGLGYTGAGVTVAVVDSGLEIGHEDLSANVVPNGSWNFNTGTTNPTNTATTGDHGTSVAGLIAMVKNSVGGIGVAPRARLKGFNLLAVSKPLESQFLDSIGASNASPNSSDVAIFNQSFGVDTNTPLSILPSDENQYRTATVGPGALRGGKGAIYVKAGGNGFIVIGNIDCTGNVGTSCENANFDPDNTLPYQIVVGATNASGIKSSYSTAGSALWVSAPGGEFGQNNSVSGNTGVVVEPAMVTTDQSTCAIGSARTAATTSSFNKGIAPNGNTFNPQCNYTNTMNGSSAATPVTVGVVALMLEANPALTWRDVKHILASTARKIDATGGVVNVALPGGTYVAEPGWIDNNASPTKFHYHNWYGFGLVDAGLAVTMATNYSVNLGTFIDAGFVPSAQLNLPIPDNSAIGVSNTIPIVTSPVAVIEAVQIRVSLTHTSLGDLGIEVISPAGTRSVIKNIEDGYAASENLSNQVFLTNAFYGESPVGPWTIKVVDGLPLDTGKLTGWAVRAYGH
jgi:subtilisin family serine protease